MGVNSRTMSLSYYKTKTTDEKDEFPIDSDINTVIFDFETASLGINPAILSMGAFAFDRFSLETTQRRMKNPQDKDTFYRNLNLKESFFLGFDISKETGEWHYKKNGTNLGKMLENEVSPYAALREFKRFIMSYRRKTEDMVILIRRTHADYIWLENLCKRLDTEMFLRHNDVIDIPSIVFAKTGDVKGHYTLEESLFEGLVSHHALTDCYLDALRICSLYQETK
ncbi:exonuclease [Klebsiella phage Miami]|uniref:RNase T-like exonuclease n=1 Tax=Klebsiella phage Miami TaxID=2767581 RepID=A0A873WCX5_9CAUD|nr:3'-5' exoribonuclease [Klebsiella quasipneumoniae]YP_010667351.1 exonuclease [Klebsiella phage Miami]QPB09267.1 RNase T-like exonuclease [Klebsiella phage Miami]